MIQRIVYTALVNGVAQFTATGSVLFDKLFDGIYGLSATEIAAIKKVYRETPPQVVQNMSPVNTAFPAYVVAMGQESQVGYFLGNDAGTATSADMYDPSLGRGQVFSTRWAHNYTIYCYSKHHDVTTYIYEVAKAAIFLQVPWLSTQNVIKVTLAGMEVQVASEYGPDYVFGRALEFRCEREFRFANDGTGLAYNIQGVSVPGGSPFASSSFPSTLIPNAQESSNG